MHLIYHCYTQCGIPVVVLVGWEFLKYLMVYINEVWLIAYFTKPTCGTFCNALISCTCLSKVHRGDKKCHTSVSSRDSYTLYPKIINCSGFRKIRDFFFKIDTWIRKKDMWSGILYSTFGLNSCERNSRVPMILMWAMSCRGPSA